jgi:Family of unknown function (DUF5946)
LVSEFPETGAAVVDAFAMQTAKDDGKRIGVVFGLVGLYLYLERKFSGNQVQKVHMELGRKKREWPSIELLEDRGQITVLDILAAPPGAERDFAIDDWYRSVWQAFGPLGSESRRSVDSAQIARMQ